MRRASHRVPLVKPPASPGESLARALAGLDVGIPADLLPSGPLSMGNFQQLLSASGRDRLIGTVVEAVVREILPVTADQLALLEEHQLDWARQSLEVERATVRVVGHLASEGIECRVLKGVALAHVAYGNPSWRVFGDVDLLIRSTEIEEAVRLLIGDLDANRPEAELRPGFDCEFGKEVLLQLGDIEVDLHRTFVPGAFGQTQVLEELFDDGTPFQLAGQSLRALEPHHMMMHAMYNLAIGDQPIRLGSVRDALLLDARLGVGTDELLAVARRSRATAVLGRAAVNAIAMVELPDGHRFHEFARIASSQAERLLLGSYSTRARSYTRPLASLLVMPGIGKRLRYGRAVSKPSKAYLASRGWTTRSHFLRMRDRIAGRG